MISGCHKNGFSLIEVLLAVGTLAIGMIFIGGTFLTGIHFSTIATERTIAAVAADEAFAKIRLYGVNTTDPNLVPFENVVLNPPIDPNEFAYPSTETNPAEKQYFWSALCRRVDVSNVQVTVFVSRKVGAGERYLVRNFDGTLDPVGSSHPIPIPVEVSQTNPYELSITDLNPSDSTNEATFINDGYTIVENTTGQIYQVVKRYAEQPDTILLDRPWDSRDIYPDPDLVWVVPPPFGGGRYLCIAVYQTVIRF